LLLTYSLCYISWLIILVREWDRERERRQPWRNLRQPHRHHSSAYWRGGAPASVAQMGDIKWKWLRWATDAEKRFNWVIEDRTDLGIFLGMEVIGWTSFALQDFLRTEDGFLLPIIAFIRIQGILTTIHCLIKDAIFLEADHIQGDTITPKAN